MMKTAYMDYNATAPMRPLVRAAMTDAFDLVGNPSSVHRVGREARAKMEKARDQVAALVGVPRDWVYFTSGGTEADNLALNGPAVERVLVSAVEHAAVLKARPDAEFINVDGNGVVDLAHLESLLDGRPTLVSVMAANNETGAIQPIKEICRIAHEQGALVHCDAVQAVGKIDFDMQEIGCDMISLSAHKIGGPQGVGALIKRDTVALQAVQKGGGQEKSMRGGTENLIGIIGFGAAAEEKLNYSNVEALRNDLETQIKALGGHVFCENVDRLPNTSCFAIEGLISERQVMALDLSGVMVSAGSACSSGTVKASHVLKAMQVDEGLANCAIRVSLGWDSTKDDIELFVQAWSKLVERVQKRKESSVCAA
ncbi:cysteine desulfurase family protein [Terasakiella sp. A23]|uniref:cysteine desulfurase family protein n=1 Tax=Terasakiella sp. FCG-A23 TaxID=3080561 RepID=UPI00295409F9|nr:cysteine desulfurase family protein [Terasakiella sp. A23]MDV7339428.1 cysteine desulfurase family protein [Terasakiella sp. A23]